MRVIVTRPAAQGAKWVARLHHQGVDACALPLIDIAPAADRMTVRAAWGTLALLRLVVFVSPNAVEHFFAERPPGAPWPAALRAASTGPGTTHALHEQGLAPAQVVEPDPGAPQFDSEALWLQLRGLDWRDAGVLFVRGDGGRDWLAGTLRDAGARVDYLAAYRRVRPALDAAAFGLLRQIAERPAEHAWLFNSSEAIDNLAAAAPGEASEQAARAGAIVTHPRIAARARQFGFTRVAMSRPGLEAVVACIQSLGP